MSPKSKAVTFFAAIVVVCMPFLFGIFRWMWAREHYQFFPLILVGVCWLIYDRWASIQWLEAENFSLRVGLYTFVSATIFVFAVRTNSHWLGLVACLSAIWAAVWLFGGQLAASELRLPFVFLLLIVPLPLNLDLMVIGELQRMAAALASAGLDMWGIRHMVSGVAIRTASKGYMVEEACSGIHSLFSALCSVVFYGVISRYGIARLFVLATLTVFWVLVANAVRVFLIVWVDSRWQISLDTGWRHDVLGVFVYLAILASAFSTDRFVRFLAPVSDFDVNFLVYEHFGASLNSLRSFLPGIFDTALVGARTSFTIGVILLACSLPFSAKATMRLLGTDDGKPEITGQELADVFKETDLPESWNGWSRTSFRTESRRKGDPFGTQSAIWTFSGHGLDLNVSIDGWFPSWHDLTYCYQGIGWKVQQAANVVSRTTDGSIPHTQLNLYKNTPVYASVCFSCIDSAMNPVNPPEIKGSLLRTIRDRLRTLEKLSNTDEKVVGPVFQIQVFCQSDREIHSDETHLITEFLVHFRGLLVKRISKP